jgi:dinuclear metal center YbgI/SA1388 family protein
MKVHEIISAIEEFAPLSLQEEYDNSGLLTGNPDEEVTGALLCIDVTEVVVDEAINCGCNVVIAHHPIIFKELRRLTGSNYVERVIIKAIRNKVAIYCAHTNLDNVRQGVNHKIAERIGLINTRVLMPASGRLMKLYTFVPHEHAPAVRQALFAAGAGRIESYDECSFNAEGYGTFRAGEESAPFVGRQGIQHREPETKVEVIFPLWLKDRVIGALMQSHPYEEVAFDLVKLENTWSQAGAGLIGEFQKPLSHEGFLKHLKDKMNLTCIRFTGSSGDPLTPLIRTVAVCGGSGSSLLANAIAAGAQVFVSSDFKYHQFFDSEGKIMICDIGHYESEQFTPEIIAEVLRRKFPTFATHFTSVNTNPINYY